MSLVTTSISRLGEIVGAEHVFSDLVRLAEYEVDGVRPAAVVQPASADEVAEIVRLAASQKFSLLATGARTKLGIGAPPRHYDVALDLARLNRIVAYDPDDLTLSVEAGIVLGQLQEQLMEKRQFLPLDPPFGARATIGGILATNASGPLRHAYGTARDLVLGMEFVTGEGVRTKSGGRVVKSVAGYDLHKLIIGSLGTLAVITTVHFKTFPMPQATSTLVASFEKCEGALALRRQVAESRLGPTAMEMVDPQMARILGAAPRLPENAWSVALAAGGNERVVERHAHDVSRMAQESQAIFFARFGGAEEAELWERIRELPQHARGFSPAATIIKISILPTQFGAAIERVGQIAERNDLPWAVLARAAGVLYAALVPARVDGETLERLAQASTALLQATSDAGGRAVIEWCPAELKRAVNVWGAAQDDVALMQKMKKAFDPHDILSPGRFYGGI